MVIVAKTSLLRTRGLDTASTRRFEFGSVIIRERHFDRVSDCFEMHYAVGLRKMILLVVENCQHLTWKIQACVAMAHGSFKSRSAMATWIIDLWKIECSIGLQQDKFTKG